MELHRGSVRASHSAVAGSYLASHKMNVGFFELNPIGALLAGEGHSLYLQKNLSNSI